MEDEANIEDSYEIVDFKDCQNSAGEMSTEEAGTSRNQVTGISAAGVNTQATNNDSKQSPNVGESESGAEGSSNAVENEKTEGNKGSLRKNGQPANVPGGKPVSENIQESIAGNINKGSLKKDGQPDESGGTPVSENIQGIPGDINKGPLRQDGQAVSHSFGIGTSESGNRQNFQGDKQGRSSPEDDTGSDADKYYPPGNKGEKTLKDAGAIPETKSSAGEKTLKDTGAIPKTKSSAASTEEPWKRFSLKIKTKSSPEINLDATRDLDPIKMQYLLWSSSQKVETTLKSEMKNMKLKVKKFSYDKEFLTIVLGEITPNSEKNIQDKIIMFLQDEVDPVSLKSVSCSSVVSPEEVLKDSLERGELGLYSDREKIYIVGISKDLNQIVKMLTQLKAEETDTKKGLSKEYIFESVVAMKIFTDLGLKEHLKTNFPSIAVRFDNERSVAVFEGDSSFLIDDAVEEIRKFKSKAIKKNEQSDASMLIELLELPEIKNNVNTWIKAKQLFLSWNTSSTNCKFTIYYREESDLLEFKNMLKQMFMELNFPIISDDKTFYFATTKEFVDFVEQHKGKNMVTKLEGSNFNIMATKDIAKRLLLLEETIKNQSPTTVQNESQTTVQSQPPTTVQSQPPTTVQSQLPTTVQSQLPTTVQNHSSTFQSQLPTTVQSQLPTTVQNQSSTKVQSQLPTTVQSQPPPTVQNQPPTFQSQLPTTVQNLSSTTVKPSSTTVQKTLQENLPSEKSSIMRPSEISLANSFKNDQDIGLGEPDKDKVYQIKSLWDFHRIQILKKFNFKSQCQHIEFLNDGIRYSGNEKKLSEEIEKFMSQHLHTEAIKIFPIAVCQFYETDWIKQVIDSSLQKKKIACYWFVDLNEMMIKVFTAEKPSLSTAVTEIINCVMYREYAKNEDSFKVLKSPDIDDILKSKMQCIRIVDEHIDKFLVVGVTHLVEQFDKLFETAKMSKIQSVTRNTGNSKCSLGIDSYMLKYIRKFKNEELNKFLRSFKVEINIENEEVFVFGTTQNVEAAAKEFRGSKLLARKWSCEVSNPALIIENLLPTIQQLEEKYQCLLTVESDARRMTQQQLAQWINWDCHQHLVLVHGCVSEMSADVIVCPTAETYTPTKLGQSILDKGGQFVYEDFTQKRVSETDAVYISSETGDLSCIMVAYAALPKSIERDLKKKMVSFLQKLLSNVDKTQLQSIVIPTMMSDQIPETTLIIWFIEAFKGIQYKLTNLKQIYLCSEDPDNAENAVKVLNDGLAKENVSFYDFTHMFENPKNDLSMHCKPASICVSPVKGSLVDQKVDMIVNSCGKDLNLKNGIVSALILKAAGQSIADECTEKYPKGVDFGEVVPTKAGELKFKLICHGALPKWTPGACFSTKILEKLVFDCLLMAESGRCKTIAFPVFGTGTLLYPWDNVAETMIQAVQKFSRMHFETVVKEVRIVMYEKDVKSIEAFQSRKLMMEKLKIKEEDPIPAPPFILESRCKNVRVRVVSQSELKFHHCAALVIIYSFEQTQHEDPNSMLQVKGIDCEKLSGRNYWSIKVFSDEQEKNYIDALKKVFLFSEEERLSSVAICLMHEKGLLPFKKQITLVRDYISNMSKIRYLQVVKLVILNREKFDTMMGETVSKQEAESKLWSSIVSGLFNLQKNHWKIMRYCNTTEVPRLLIYTIGMDVKSTQDMFDEFVQNVESEVKKDNKHFGASMKQHKAGRETDIDNIWIRTEVQSTGLKMIPLPDFICNQLDEATKLDLPSAEIRVGKDLYVFMFDNFMYYINDQYNGTSGKFYKHGGPEDPSQAADTAKEQKQDEYKRQTSKDQGDNYFSTSEKHKADIKIEMDNKWMITEKQSTELKTIPLPAVICKQLDEAVQSRLHGTEINYENNLYVFNFEESTYYINNMYGQHMSGKFYKQGGPGDPSQATDTAKEQKQDKYKRQTSIDEIFEEVYGDISKTLLKSYNITEITKIIQGKFLGVEMMPVTTDKFTFKFKTVKLLEDVNQFLKDQYKIPGDCVHKSELQPTAPPRKKKNDGSLPHSKSELRVKMAKEQFEKITFFIQDNILSSQLKHDGNQLILQLKSPKDYKKYEEMITREISNIDQMPQVDIPMENQLNMEDIQHFMTTDFSSILCRIVGNVVQLSGPSYDKLMQAKHRIEIVMGSKQETKGRRGRRFADPVDQYKRDSNSSDMHSDAASQSKSQSYSPSSATAISMMQVYTTTEGITVKVYNGNILKLDVDCIVNAANESLSHGGGVAAVISGAAGYQFDQESKDYIQRKGNLAVGECCSTSAGNLKYRNVIHAVGPRWSDYKYDQKKLCAFDLKQSIIHSFQEAERLNLRSIAIPSISAGIFGVPKELCVAEYGNAVTEFSKSRKSGTCLKEIHFVDKDLGLVSLIQNEFDKIFKPLPQQNSGLPAKGSGRHNFQRSVSSGSGNNSFQQGSSLGGSRSINHTAQFEVKNSLRIYVKIGNITKCEVDAIACPQDELKMYRGAIATEVEKIGGSDYKTQFDRLFLTKYGSIRMPAPSNCPWKYIIQTVPPRWNLEATRNNQVFERNLKETVSNILNEAKYGNIKTVAIPLMGIAEKGYDTPVKTFAEQFMKAIFQQFDTRNFTVKEIHIVVHDIATVTTIIDVFSSMENQGVKRLGPPVRRQSEGQGEEPMEVEVYGKEKENCCICLDKLMKPKKLACGHTFCTECIEQHFKFKPSCPQCGAIHGTITGTQPKGKMTKRTKNYSLPGFHGTDTIEIEYIIYSGVQGEEHPNPGTRFDGITRTAFLPDNRKGRLIARLLEVAFNRRLIFTIGTSTTTGKTGVVTWNDIHHKTNSKPNTQFGYPDEGYFDRVLEELSVKGVTEKDLKD